MAKSNYLIEIQILIGNCYNLTEKNVVPNLEKSGRFLTLFMGRGSAEASVEMAEASEFGRTQF